VIFETARIVANEEYGPGHYVLTLQCEAPLPRIQAGQFANLQCEQGDEYSILRPFSVLFEHASEGRLGIYYKILGRMSDKLSRQPPGAQLNCLYPLGQPFVIPESARRIALVGGGVGIAPLLYLQEQLAKTHPQLEVRAYFGGRSAPDLVPRLLAQYDFPQELATDDGSLGFRGNVIECFSRGGMDYDAVYTCGPNPMMAALKAALPQGLAAYASLEEYMACGVGACYGCTALIEAGGSERRLTVCKDGPIFDLRQVVFET
jgi:dihydroorotate dehydrogenase electron transfer subunit